MRTRAARAAAAPDAAASPPPAPLLRTLSGAALRNEDLHAARREWHVSPPAWAAPALLSCLSDARDAPLLYALLNVAAVVPPAAAALLFCAPPSHLLGAAYLFVMYALFVQRFMLALHYAQHRNIFRPGAPRLRVVAASACVALCGRGVRGAVRARRML
jgi:hypothetical protein